MILALPIDCFPLGKFVKFQLLHLSGYLLDLISIKPPVSQCVLRALKILRFQVIFDIISETCTNRCHMSDTSISKLVSSFSKLHKVSNRIRNLANRIHKKGFQRTCGTRSNDDMQFCLHHPLAPKLN